MRNVAVIGVGQTKFGEHWDKSLKDLSLESALASVKDANIAVNDIQSLYVGNMAAGRFADQEHVASVVASQLGLNVSATRCEGACASGSIAFRNAYLAIASGKYDIVMALGVEKMNDLKTGDVMAALMGAGDAEFESSVGLTFSGLYAMIARAHMQKYGTTSEQLAMVSVNNHKNAVGNVYAQFPSKISIQDVLKSSMVSDPLHVLDCSPITDGSAAVILASENVAKMLEIPIWIASSEHATDTVALHERKSLTEMLSVKLAAKKAYENAFVKPKDIDFAEVHDCFSINEIVNIEDLGFCEKGVGGKFVESGAIALDGEKPINTTGGLKGIGHPVGATGLRQVGDVVKQLRGNSHNQLKDVKTGLTLNVGGSGSTAVVNILKIEV